VAKGRVDYNITWTCIGEDFHCLSTRSGRGMTIVAVRRNPKQHFYKMWSKYKSHSYYLTSCTLPVSSVCLFVPLSLSYCSQSLRLVCSRSHELLILGITVRIFLMQWFPLAFCMIVFRHTVGLLWTSYQPISELYLQGTTLSISLIVLNR
jgi:hypothetical protein